MNFNQQYMRIFFRSEHFIENEKGGNHWMQGPVIREDWVELTSRNTMFLAEWGHAFQRRTTFSSTDERRALS